MKPKSAQEFWKLDDNTPVIVDVDTGVDDAIALILLHKWLAGRKVSLTTVGGNVELDKVTCNTLGILDFLNWDIPVYAGSPKSISGSSFVHAPEFHGENGLVGIDLRNHLQVCADSATTAMTKLLNKGPVVVICLGPATNLAQTLRSQPELAANLYVIMMGGALKSPGNQDNNSEFNFYQDPKAVEIIWQSGCSVAVVSLDVTKECLITSDELLTWPGGNNQQTVKLMINRWYDLFGRSHSRSFELYDPLAASALTEDHLSFTRQRLSIRTDGINRGQVFADTNGHTMWWADHVNADSFKKDFLKSLSD